MLNRKPLAPNNRNGTMRGAFLASLESAASTVNYPKSREESSIVIWKTAGKQNSEGFGGGNRVKKR
jgi:hypothetical protein